jgi:hypothetical protein
MGTNYTLLVCTFTLSATLLFVNGYGWLALVAALLAAGMGFVLVRLLIRIDRADRMP